MGESTWFGNVTPPPAAASGQQSAAARQEDDGYAARLPYLLGILVPIGLGVFWYFSEMACPGKEARGEKARQLIGERTLLGTFSSDSKSFIMVVLFFAILAFIAVV